MTDIINNNMIIDSFTFLNEKELVELRVKYLNEVVDHFLIIEADVTHTGKQKKWNFFNNSFKSSYFYANRNWMVLRKWLVLYYYNECSN